MPRPASEAHLRLTTSAALLCLLEALPEGLSDFHRQALTSASRLLTEDAIIAFERSEATPA